MKDGLGRTIEYLRISLTDRCNFRCIYCMPEEGVCSLPHDEILRIEEMAHIVRIAADLGIKSVRLTGGEPLVRKGVVDLVREIANTPGIENVSMTTNGVLLPKMADDLKRAGLSRVNISLDTLDPAQFRAITRLGRVEQTLAGIDAALESALDPVKVNCVVVRRLRQDVFSLARLTVSRPVHVRFIEYMPIGDERTGTDRARDDHDCTDRACDDHIRTNRARASRSSTRTQLHPRSPAEGGIIENRLRRFSSVSLNSL